MSTILNIKIFDNYYQYKKHIDNELGKLSTNNKFIFNSKFNNDRYVKERINKKTWYGEHIKSKLQLQNYKTFAYSDIYLKIKNDILKQIDKKLFSKLSKKKLTFNETFGVFSFDRVMMGMQRKKELFCKQKNEIVQWSEVDVLENKKIITKDEKYPVEVRNAVNENGKPKIKTSNKKIFCFFPQKPKNTKAIELFIGGDINANTSSQQAIYKSIPTIIIAEECIKNGYKVQVNYHAGGIHNEKKVLCIAPIKCFNEPLDIDLLLLLSCDVAHARYQGFIDTIANANYFNINVNNGLGGSIYNTDLSDLFEKNYNLNIINPETTKLFIPETWSESEAIKQIKETINQLSNEN